MPRYHCSGRGPEVITLHGYWRSTASYRVRIALELKGLRYYQVTHDLRTGAQRAKEFTALSPQGLVPALDIDGEILSQSLAIIEWLDERWSDPPLLPPDALGRARVRAMAQLVACDIHPLNNLRVLTQLRQQSDSDEALVARWIARWIKDGFAALEISIARHGGQFAYGDLPSMADCCLVPQLYSAERFGVDVSNYPHVRAVADRARALESFRSAEPAAQPDAD